MGQGGQGLGSESGLSDQAQIVEVVQNWALWRDAGDWERFRTVWHDDGWMTATWFQGPAAEFIKVSKAGFEVQRCDTLLTYRDQPVVLGLTAQRQ